MQNGEIGEPHLLHIISRDPAPPPIDYIKKSGGLFLDMAIHDFDMARYIVGSEVEEIFASGAVRVDPAIGDAGDLDTALVVLRFSSGVIGTIDNSRQAVYGYDQRLEVFGSGGSIRTENNCPNAVTVFGKESIYGDLPLHFFIERYAASYIEEMSQFVDAVLTGGPVPVGGADGRVPVVMALAAPEVLSGKPSCEVGRDRFGCIRNCEVMAFLGRWLVDSPALAHHGNPRRKRGNALPADSLVTRSGYLRRPSPLSNSWPAWLCEQRPSLA